MANSKVDAARAGLVELSRALADSGHQGQARLVLRLVVELVPTVRAALLAQALEATVGNLSRAAEWLGVSHRTAARWVEADDELRGVLAETRER